MPNRGEYVYSCFNGTIEKALFLEESVDVTAGATAPTWVVQKAHKRVRVQPSFYPYNSPGAAYAGWLQELREALPVAHDGVKAAQEHLAYIEGEIQRTTDLLAALTAVPTGGEK
jgi:hypothetical protein